MFIAIVSLLAVVLTPAATHQPQSEHPVLAQVKAGVKDPTKPFTLLVRLKVKDAQGPKFEAAFAKAGRESRREKGNVAYALSRSTKEPARYVLYERWENLAALEAHLKTQHFAALMAETGELFDGAPEVDVFVP